MFPYARIRIGCTPYTVPTSKMQGVVWPFLLSVARRAREREIEREMSSHGNSISANDPRQPSAAKPYVAQMVSPQDLPVDYSGFIAVIFGIAGVMFRVRITHHPSASLPHSLKYIRLNFCKFTDLLYAYTYVHTGTYIFLWHSDVPSWNIWCSFLVISIFAVQAKLVACYHILCSIPRQHAECREWPQADFHGHDVCFPF